MDIPHSGIGNAYPDVIQIFCQIGFDLLPEDEFTQSVDHVVDLGLASLRSAMLDSDEFSEQPVVSRMARRTFSFGDHPLEHRCGGVFDYTESGFDPTVFAVEIGTRALPGDACAEDAGSTSDIIEMNAPAIF